MSFDPISYAMGVRAGGGGGGNPNYVETVEGTLANPWGSVEPEALYTELADNAASILLTASIGSNTVTLPIVADTTFSRFKAVTAADNNEGVDTYIAGYDESGTLLTFVRATALSDSGSIDNLISLAFAVPVTLTIIHHPLLTN